MSLTDRALEVGYKLLDKVPPLCLRIAIVQFLRATLSGRALFQTLYSDPSSVRCVVNGSER